LCELEFEHNDQLPGGRMLKRGRDRASGRLGYQPRRLAHLAQAVARFSLADSGSLMEDAPVTHHHHRHKHSRWHRFVRHNPGLFFGGILLILILGIIVALFWVLSDASFLKGGG
jgi:hypothetical protein